MPIKRLEGARATLPAGYQFGDARPHHHVFNAISGYCVCGLQYAPHLLPYFEHGGRVGEPPPTWMPDTRPPFVTRLPPGATIADVPPDRSWNVIEGEHFESDAEHHRTIEGAEP